MAVNSIIQIILRKILSSFFYLPSILKKRDGVIVLSYHRVNDELPPSEMSVTTQTFRRQMEYLKKSNYEVIGIKDMLKTFNSEAKKVVITFDDGFRDNYLNAFPVLKELGFKATVFLVTGMINTEKKFKRYYCQAGREMLNWEEIDEMAEYGISFAPHTVNHPLLSQIPEDQAKQEMIESKRAVDEKLGNNALNAFCYPSGYYNESVKNLVKEAGFSCAFTVKPGINNIKNCDLFELKRTAVNGKDSLFDFKKKLAGAYDPLHKFVQAKKQRKNYSGKTNILYIIWSLGLGGAERVVINLAKYADRDKFNSVICCLNDKGVFANEAESAGIKVIALNKKTGLDFGIIPKIVNVIKENNIHIVNTHLWGANFWGRIAAVKAGVPVIIATEHNEDTWKNILHFILDKILSFWTDKIIAVSEGAKNFYNKKAGISLRKIEVIRNGIDIEKYQNAADKKAEFGIGQGQITLGIIGRLVPQKGHSFLLHAVKGLLPEHNLKTLIIGAGPEEERLKQLSNKLGLNGSVIFTGLRKDIPELLNTIDVLVMPSLREGLPIIALEAMSAGTPIIASRVGGIPELIRHKDTGMLVEAKDIPALKSAITELAHDKKLREQISFNAKKLIEEEFSISNMLNKAEGLFQQIYAQKTK